MRAAQGRYIAHPEKANVRLLGFDFKFRSRFSITVHFQVLSAVMTCLFVPSRFLCARRFAVIVRGRNGELFKPPLHNASGLFCQGEQAAVSCKEHARVGMEYVKNRRFSLSTGTRVASYNVEGNKNAVNCRHHAKDDMVDVQAVFTPLVGEPHPAIFQAAG